MSADFLSICAISVLHPKHSVGLERIPFLEQLIDAL